MENIILKYLTINKNSNEIYDYKSINKFQNILKLNKDFFAVYNNNNIEIYNSYETIPNYLHNNILFYIHKTNNNKFYFQKKYQNLIFSNKAYLPLFDIFQNKINNINNNNNNIKYNLSVGDVIKIGRIEIKIKKINIENNQKNIYNNFITKSKNQKNIKKNNNNNINNIKNNNEENKKKFCRICFEDESISPLINPCQCKGDIKYIHLTCLKKWIKTKIFKQTINKEKFIIYSYEKIFCEICKTEIPDLIKKEDNHIYEIWNFNDDIPFKNYIIFQINRKINKSYDNNNNEINTIYIINLIKNKNITIGRSVYCDIIIKNLSISRIHCNLKLDASDNKIYINDNNSKYGTVVLLQSDFMEIYEEPLFLQFDKFLISLNVNKKKNNNKKRNKFCCFNENKNNNNNKKRYEFSPIEKYNSVNSKNINYLDSFKLKEEQNEIQNLKTEINFNSVLSDFEINNNNNNIIFKKNKKKYFDNNNNNINIINNNNINNKDNFSDLIIGDEYVNLSPKLNQYVFKTLNSIDDYSLKFKLKNNKNNSSNSINKKINLKTIIKSKY